MAIFLRGRSKSPRRLAPELAVYNTIKTRSAWCMQCRKDVKCVEASLCLWLEMCVCFHEELLPHFLSVLHWFWLAGGEVAVEGEIRGGGRIINVAFVLCPARDLVWMSDWQVREVDRALGDAGLVGPVCLFKERWQQEERGELLCSSPVCTKVLYKGYIISYNYLKNIFF